MNAARRLGELQVHARAPRHLVGAGEPRVGGFREARVVVGVTAEHLVEVACPLQPLPGERPQRLEHLVAGVPARVVGGQHRLRHQPRAGVEDVPRLEAVVRRHRGGRVARRSSAGTRRSALEQRAFTRFEQLVRPLDRAPQGLVALGRAAATAGQQLEALVEAGGDVGRRHDRHPRRRQLDRERDAVEPAADLGDGLGVATRRARTRAAPRAPARRTAAPPRWPSPPRRRRRAPGARARSAATPARPRRRAPRGWWRGCARRGSRAAAPRRDDRPPATRCSQLSSTSTSSRMRSASITLSASDGRGPGQHAERRGHHLPELLVVLRGRELAQPRAVGEARGDVERDLDRDAALPDASDAGHRDQPRREQRVGDRLALDRATDERGQLAGEVAGHRVERAQRRELARQARRRPPGRCARVVRGRAAGARRGRRARSRRGARRAGSPRWRATPRPAPRAPSSSPGRRGWWRGRSSRRRAPPRRRCAGPCAPAARRAPPRSRRRGSVAPRGRRRARPGWW